MSTTCKRTKKRLLQSNNIQESDYKQSSRESFQPETDDEYNDIASKEDIADSIQFNSMEVEEVETLNIRYRSKTKSHDTQSKSISSKLNDIFQSPFMSINSSYAASSSSYTRSSTPQPQTITENHDTTSFCSPVDSRHSTPSWPVGPNSNDFIGSEQREFKQAKIIKSCRKNNVNHCEEQSQPTQNDEETDQEVEKVIMAINHKQRKLGCAYYNLETCKLYLMEDMEESPPYDLVNLLRYQILPSVIITNSCADDDFIEVLKAQDDSIPFETELVIRPSSEFLYVSAKTKLLSIRLGLQNHVNSIIESDKREMYLKLSSILNMESVETICCAGALIGYISRTELTGGLQVEVAGIEQFSLKRFLHINADALCSLQIFEDESHPNMHMQAKSKEGLSLFGILNNTRTSLGKKMFKQWFLRPTLDLTVIGERQHTIEHFLKPGNLEYAEQLVSCLKNIKNIPRIIHNMKRNMKVKDWQSLLQFAFYCLKIRNIVRESNQSENIPIFTKIRETFVVSDLKNIGSYINDVVDFDESVEENRIVIKPHIDEKLDYMKRTYDGLNELLSDIAREISTNIPTEFSSTLNVIYFPQLGYLITVPLKPEWKEEEDFKIDGLYYQFSTATTVYYKNDKMKELDAFFGDIHGLIVDREIEIMQKLQEHILEYVPLLLESTEVCAELDCLLSLTECARKYKYCRPRVVNENVLEIEKGRHPLQELCVDVFVANDTKIAGGNGITSENDNMTDDPTTSSEKVAYKSVMLLSGANFSGKSVYLKQVALITYMAHIGSFVPADSATIGLTDKIFTRVQTRETVSKIQSAFMIDLQQISIALRNSTSRSLLIFDEFGKGTGSTDGAGLFCGVVEYLLNLGRDCPKVIAATHFHEIFENNILSQTLPITLNTMEIMKEDEQEELTFLYRLMPGRSTSSWGTFCAALAGVPSPVIKRASHLSQLFARYESIPSPFDDDRERRAYATREEVARKFVKLDFEEDEDLEIFFELVDELTR
ncbi:1562_t:CDS:10 [Funneliformis caledonium]|uniref:DNA mismatch repair protein MSH5 n=1 Tax=Funneliformis caledonium TaxID=1117310 RepID=A0A9N9G7R4_9GLOM|nr:1562_t:CDS:10 [Funneliformis caledonium]